MKEDFQAIGIISEDSLVGRLHFHEIEYVVKPFPLIPSL